jgi:hypothetical protein
MIKKTHKKLFIVITLLMLVVVMATGSGCTALDPCVREKDQCIEKCPTVVIAKQLCNEKCNYQFDQCKGKY